MNCVYKLTFNKRKYNNIQPYYYIGSKSNYSFENGLIKDRFQRVYYGSSSYKNYDEIVKNDNVTVEIIKIFENYTDALNYESKIQIKLDVVADTKYFNLSIATTNSFSNPEFATYKNIYTGKTVRLKRTHVKVLNGEYVGITKNCNMSEETKVKISKANVGKNNSFYGKKHSKETRKKISDKNKGRKLSEERKKWFIENVAKGKKSAAHRKKIGRTGLIMLKNINTLKTIRVKKTESHLYDKSIWVNPYKLSNNKSTGSRWVTNGIRNIKISKNSKIPEGYYHGRVYTNWNLNKGKNNEDNKN